MGCFEMNRNLLSVIDQIGKEKGIKGQVIISAVESAILTAAKKKYGELDNIQVKLDAQTGEIEVICLKKIAESVSDPRNEISFEEAKKIDDAAELGDEIGFLVETGDFGRIAAQTAKQVIFQRVREAEWESVHREYSVRQGEIISGMILGQERRNYIVELGKTEAMLPYKEQVPGENYRRGDRVRAYLLEVLSSAKGPQIVLSRTHPNFVAKLFEMEVPEIAGNVIMIKGVVREPGDRTKIAVYSKDAAVDPVGACVGVRGCRVQAVVRELRGEKIDIITWTDDHRTFIGESLSPAVIEKVGINEVARSAMVVVSEQQLSLAIGKKGQNVRLAAKLTGWKIDLINQVEYEKERAREREQAVAAAFSHEQRLQEALENGVAVKAAPERPALSDLADMPDMNEAFLAALKELGIDTIEKLADTGGDVFLGCPGIGIEVAAKMIESAREILKERE